MCGITGFFDFKNPEPRPVLIKKMTDLITHRGPDSDGHHIDGGIHLGMRRLKVIDLESGNQPIHDGEKHLWIIFNGEIYNYRELRQDLERRGHHFYTHSDTEVILHLYKEKGSACLQDLIGMFAFCILDPSDPSLFLARDRLGIKPLFYHHSNAGFAFGSEIKSLLEIPWISKDLDLQAISHFLSLNYLPSPWTPFQSIRHLEPGHWMRVSRKGLEIQSYWDIPENVITDITEEEAIKEIERRFHKSIERRLIADVPIGAFLSGGMDSSMIVAFMREHKHDKLKTFSVGFEDPRYNETSYAREVANFFGTEHHEIILKSRDVETLLPQVAWHADNLLADQAALALYAVSKLAKEHVTVCLSGDGGDEIFVGYPTFIADHYQPTYAAIPKWIRKGIIENIVRLLPTSSGKLSFDYKARKFIEAGDFDLAKAHYWWRTVLTETEKRNLLRPEILKEIPKLEAYPCYERYLKNSTFQEFGNIALKADLKVWLAGNNLYKVDTMTMAHGLEGRVPFLDHELVEFMSRLPFSLKFKNRQLKYLQKKLMASKLPSRILHRKKAGWHMPISQWMKLEPLFRKESVTAASLMNLVSTESLHAMLEEHQKGARNHAFKLWGLSTLNQWLIHMKIRI